MKLVALVPMRHESERVPGKNYRSFNGLPLFYHIISTLLECPSIEKIVIDTDSPIIISEVKKSFKDIILLNRPKHLIPGTVPMNDIINYDVSQVEADFYLQTHSTNPLLTSKTISQAIDHFIQNERLYDSLFTVTKMQKRFWDSQIKPVNHNPDELLRTQDLEPLFEENSCMYIFKKETIVNYGNRIGKHPCMFEINADEAWDIDEELDFEIIEFLLKKKSNSK